MIRSLFILFLGFSLNSFAQKANPYGLKVINTMAEYQATVKNHSSKRLVEIKSYIPDIQLDIRYATKNNFTRQVVYKQARAFGRLPVVRALQNVQNELKAQGLGLKIYDGYRPYDVTV